MARDMQTFRMDQAEWEAFGAKCAANGEPSRSAVLRSLILDYTRAGVISCPRCSFTTPDTTMGAASMRRHRLEKHS